MKKIISIIVVLIIVLSAIGCSGGSKKNQVVYVEKSARYGDLKITFLEYELKHMSTGTYPRIHLLVENNGNDKYIMNADSFVAFGDGVDIGECESSYGWTDGRAGNCTNTRLELQPGRSGEIWVNYERHDISEYDLVEFDYVYSPFAKRWGKITFAINLDDSEYNQTNSYESIDLEKAIIGTWRFMDTKHEYAKDHYEAYTFYADYTGIYQTAYNTYSITYYLDDDDLYVDSQYIGQCELDGDYLTLIYWFGNVATRHYYEKTEDYQPGSSESTNNAALIGSSESIDLAKAIIGTWKLWYCGEIDHYIVSISIYDDETCWCQYNDGSSEHFLYELLELIGHNTLWLYNDSHYYDFEIQYKQDYPFEDDECLILSLYDDLDVQSFEGWYVKVK